jgi:hypothetical protein
VPGARRLRRMDGLSRLGRRFAAKRTNQRQMALFPDARVVAAPSVNTVNREPRGLWAIVVYPRRRRAFAYLVELVLRFLCMGGPAMLRKMNDSD